MLLLQFLLELAEAGGPRFGVLADPPVVDQPDRDGVEEVQLLPATFARDHEPRLLQLLQVLHDPEPGHVEALLELAQGLTVFAVELVEQAPPGRIGQRLEHLVHASKIGDQMVTCQGADRARVAPISSGTSRYSRNNVRSYTSFVRPA